MVQCYIYVIFIKQVLGNF